MQLLERVKEAAWVRLDKARLTDTKETSRQHWILLLGVVVGAVVMPLAAVAVVVMWPLLLGVAVVHRHALRGRPPRLHYQQHPRNASLLRRCPALHAPYRPSPYTVALGRSFAGHAQTILHEIIRPPPPMRFTREIVDLGDGCVAVDHYPCPHFDHSSPVMLILHGLSGGSHTQYVRHYVAILEQRGFRPVVMNARGCGSSSLQTPKGFTCHYTGDVKLIVNHVRKMYPNVPFFATGFSMGANLLTKYLGEEKDATPLTAAIAVANPFDFTVLDKWLAAPVNRHSYNFIFTKALVGYVNRHRDVFKTHQKLDLARLTRVKTLQEFDQHFTCPLWGFQTPQEYYKASGSRNYLSSVKIPLLVINALDDPIIPPSAIPFDAFLRNPNIILATTDMGGHLAWLEGWRPTATNWADRVCVEFAESVLDHVVASMT